MTTPMVLYWVAPVQLDPKLRCRVAHVTSVQYFGYTLQNEYRIKYHNNAILKYFEDAAHTWSSDIPPQETWIPIVISCKYMGIVLVCIKVYILQSWEMYFPLFLFVLHSIMDMSSLSAMTFRTAVG